jgi:hypothetical protein
MTLDAEVLQRHPLPVSIERLQESVKELEQQITTYEEIVHQFEVRHGCSLKSYERQIAQREIPEHPSWEEALEWGIALDEIERLRIILRSLQWILNLLR